MKQPEMFESYEEMLFALLMGQVSELEGEELLAKNEELKKDPAAAVPEELDKKCREIIKKEFAKQKRREMAARAYRVFEKVTVAAFVIAVLFSAVWAISPQTRAATLNFLVKISDSSMGLTFGETRGETLNNPEQNVLAGYVIPKIPKSFHLANTVSDERCEGQLFKNENGDNILIQVVYGENAAIHNVDTEETDSAEEMDINGFAALLIQKGERIQITLTDAARGKYIDVVTNGVERETALNIARGIKAAE